MDIESTKDKAAMRRELRRGAIQSHLSKIKNCLFLSERNARVLLHKLQSCYIRKQLISDIERIVTPTKQAHASIIKNEQWDKIVIMMTDHSELVNPVWDFIIESVLTPIKVTIQKAYDEQKLKHFSRIFLRLDLGKLDRNKKIKIAEQILLDSEKLYSRSHEENIHFEESVDDHLNKIEETLCKMHTALETISSEAHPSEFPKIKGALRQRFQQMSQIEDFLTHLYAKLEKNIQIQQTEKQEYERRIDELKFEMECIKENLNNVSFENEALRSGVNDLVVEMKQRENDHEAAKAKLESKLDAIEKETVMLQDDIVTKDEVIHEKSEEAKQSASKLDEFAEEQKKTFQEHKMIVKQHQQIIEEQKQTIEIQNEKLSDLTEKFEILMKVAESSISQPKRPNVQTLTFNPGK